MLIELVTHVRLGNTSYSGQWPKFPVAAIHFLCEDMLSDTPSLILNQSQLCVSLFYQLLYDPGNRTSPGFSEVEKLEEELVYLTF